MNHKTVLSILFAEIGGLSALKYITSPDFLKVCVTAFVSAVIGVSIKFLIDFTIKKIKELIK